MRARTSPSSRVLCARVNRFTDHCNAMRLRSEVAITCMASTASHLPVAEVEASADSSAAETYRLMSDVHKVLQDYASALAIVSMWLAPVLIGLGQELLTAHAGHVQGVSSKMAPWTAAAVGVSLGLLKSTAGAVQACAAATNIRAMQLHAACEAHIEVVQAELDRHEQAAKEHQKFANSIDWDTVKAAVPTSVSTGAAAGSLLAYLESQAAYVAACNTWTGWLFGVAAPAGFAATVLPFAVPAAVGMGYTGYKYWKGKKDRQYSAERAKEEMKAYGERLDALVTLSTNHLAALRVSLVVLDRSAIHGQAVSTLAIDVHKLATLLSDVQHSYMGGADSICASMFVTAPGDESDHKQTGGINEYKSSSGCGSSSSSSSRDSINDSSSSISSRRQVLSSIETAQQYLRALKVHWHMIRAGAVAVGNRCSISADSDFLLAFLQQGGAVQDALDSQGATAERAFQLLQLMHEASEHGGVVESVLHFDGGTAVE